MVDQTSRDTRLSPRSDWPAVVAVFVLVIGMTYSDDAVEFIATSSGRDFPDLRWFILVVDILLVAGTAVLKWYMIGQPRGGAFVRDLVRGWWIIGAGLVIVLHLMLLMSPGPPRGWAVGHSPGLTLLTNAAFVAAMGMMLVSAKTPGGARAWIIPVVVGTFVAQLASALWYPVINTEDGCADNVSTEYFNGMVQVLPVMLVTLGLEVNYLRSTNAVREPGQRAVAVLTVLLLCIGEGLAFSMLVEGDRVSCGSAAIWHQYIAFVLTAHAAAISLATLAYLLLATTKRTSK